MSVSTRPQTTFLFAMLAASLAACGTEDGPPTTPPTKLPASIQSFSASSMRVAAGQSVVLSYTVLDATSVRIDASGSMEPVLAPTSMLTGMVSTPAIDVATTFTLTASDGTTTKTASLTIEVLPPEAVRVTSFEAAPSMIEAGQTATLEWETANAETVRIVDDRGLVVLDPAPASGSRTVTPTITTTYELTALGVGGPIVRTATVSVRRPSPVIGSFVAAPNTIERGERTTLSWTVTGAMRIEVTDGSGNVVYDGNDGTRMETVSPVRNESYTLRAENRFGAVDATVMVTVNQPMMAAIDDFAVNPTTVSVGEPAQVTWSVRDAPGGIRLTANGRTATTSRSLIGNFTLSATTTTELELTAINPNGNATARLTLEVRPGAPQITSFVATPPTAAVGAPVELSWSVRGATSLRLLRTQPQPTEIDGAAPSDGMRSLVLTATSTFLLEATNGNGTSTQMLSVVAERAPRILSFSARPNVFRTSPAMITVLWETASAPRVSLLEDGNTVPSFPGGAAGNAMISVSNTTELTLVAESAAGRVTSVITVARLVDEVEPNDTATTANALNGGGVAGTIGAPNDADWFAVVVPDGGSITAEIGDGSGGCAFDTHLTLVDVDRVSIRGTDDDDGVGPCAAIHPARDAFASNLPAGTYFLTVRGRQGLLGPYNLVVRVSPAACGNGVVEGLAGEQCDDGNLSGGDACDASCRFPVLDSVTGPGGPVTTFTGALSPAGTQLFYRIDLSSPGWIRAETFTPAAGACTLPSDTVLTLYDAAGNVLGSDDDGGIDRCSRIEPRAHVWALRGPGAYFLRVSEFRDDDVLDPVLVRIETFAPGCGNGVVEPQAPFGEACDDGNLNANDGCDNLCQFEGAREREPNDTPAAAVIITSTPADMLGQIAPIGDEDWYVVDIPQGYHLEAFLSVGGSGICSADPRGRLELFDPDGTTLRASDAGSGFDGNCGRIAPDTYPGATTDLPAGRYYLRVRELGDDALVPNYILSIRVIAPGCGNGVRDSGLLEQCDDGNRRDGDGCTIDCRWEIAHTITGTGASHVFDLAMTGDFAIVRVDLSIAGQSITATAADPSGACTVDTFLAFANDNFDVLIEDRDDGPGDCAALHVPRDREVTNLETGSYYLQVANTGAAGGLVRLSVGILSPMCGNGIRETRAGEQCDDGNRIDGDGCSPICESQPLTAYLAPGASATIAESITSLGEVDTYEIRVSRPAYLRATVYEPTAASGGCPNADTFMRLYAADGVTQLGSDDLDGPGFCSAIDPSRDPFTRLSTGTYFLTVEDFDRDGLIPAYELVLSSVPADVCGNGVVEPGETCDDANTRDGDGCSAMCAYEATVVNEAEPNGTRPEATPTGLAAAGSVTVSGRIEGGADRDYFSFVVPANTSASLTAFTYSTIGQPTSCGPGVDTEIWIEDASGAVLRNNDDANGLCSRVSGVAVTGGATPTTYYLRVEYYSSTGTPVPFSYFADIILQ